jgi:hypothetical protein
MYRWARIRRETERRPKHHMVTLNVLVASRASWGGLRPSTGAVGEAPGCSRSYRSMGLTPPSEWKQLKVIGYRRRRHLDA